MATEKSIVPETTAPEVLPTAAPVEPKREWRQPRVTETGIVEVTAMTTNNIGGDGGMYS